jgi:hypothetical protein
MPAARFLQQGATDMKLIKPEKAGKYVAKVLREIDGCNAASQIAILTVAMHMTLSRSLSPETADRLTRQFDDAVLRSFEDATVVPFRSTTPRR